MDWVLQLCKYVIQFAGEVIAMEIEVLQVSQDSKSQQQCTTKTIGREVEMSQVTQSSQFSRNRADEPVVGQI
jgi:hypothetical protein